MSECASGSCDSCGVSGCAERNGGQASMLENPHELSNVKKVIAVVSGKGGVGKSLVTGMLSVQSRRRDFKTAVLDADITGPSIPKMFGIKTKAQGDALGIYPVTTKTGIEIMSVNLLLENDTDPVVWRGPVIGGTVKQFWTDVIWKDIDYMFIDMPPGTGDVPLTVFQSIPVDGIIIVTSPQELVGMIVEKAVKMANLMNIPIIGIIENYSYLECPDCGKKIYPFGESKVKETAKAFGLPVLEQLPIDPELAKQCDLGVIEAFESPYLEEVMDAVEGLN